MREQIENWLRGDNAALTIFDKRSCWTLIRLRKRAHLDCIYKQDADRMQDTKIFGDFEFAGIYNREDGRMYAAKDWMDNLCNGTMKKKGEIKADIEQRVREIVDATIDNNRDNLPIKSVEEITDIYALREYERNIDYEAAATARRMFLDGKTPEDITVCCNYKAEDIPDADFLDWITDCEEYCQRTAAAHIAKKKETLFIKFLSNEAIKTELIALMNDAENDVHYIKAIRMAVEKSGFTVNVTTEIDGKELTFKSPSSPLYRDPQDYGYFEHTLSVKDRAKFKELYEGKDRYFPKDIIKITYSRAVIYEKRRLNS